MKKALMFFTIFRIRPSKYVLLLFLLWAVPLWTIAETISGTVKDSATSVMLSGVKVKIAAPACSTQTNTAGYFSLNIPTTEIAPRAAPKTTMKIFYDPSKNYFLWNGEEKVFVEVLNGKGEIAKGDKLSPGQYFAVCHSESFSGVFRFLNIAGQRQSFIVESGGGIGKKASAKTIAGYSVDFSKDKYRPLSLPASAGQVLTVSLSPLVVPRDSAEANFGVALDSLGTVKIKVIFPKD